MAEAQTPNYSFNLPTVGGDDNVWGEFLNANWSSIDGILWSVSGVANAALTPAAGDARYLRLTGGSVTGATSFPIVVSPLLSGTSGGAPPALINGPNPGDNSQTVPTTSWVNQAVSAAIGAIPPPPSPPSPSNAAPAMNGTAAAGSSALYARGDHVHPTDTSRLAIAGGTLTGPLTLAADPAAALGAASKQYVDASAAVILGSGAAYGGFVNRLRNGTIDVWQRGTSISCPASVNTYTADGWIVAPTGATINATQGATFSGALSRQSLVLNAATGASSVDLSQRIESFVSAPLISKPCTFQCRIFNNTSAAITPQFGVLYANAADNWTAFTTEQTTVNLQTIAAGATAVVAYTFSASLNARNGYAVFMRFGGALNAASGYVAVTDCDLRATPGVATGLNANPPPPELRPIASELAFCQRYYFAGSNFTGGTFFGGQVTTGSNYFATRNYPVPMRATPTVAFTTAGQSGFPAASGSLNAGNALGCQELRAANATSPSGYFSSNVTASAEL